MRLAPSGSAAFGTAIGASGDWLALGAPAEEAVYLYAYDSTAGWTLSERLQGASGSEFGHSLALYDRHLLVGAPLEEAAHLYRQDAGAWDSVTTLVAPAPLQHGRFGASVALFSIYAFVGAPERSAEDGAVLVYEESTPGVWDYKQELHSPAAGGQFGSALSLTSEYALVGAPLADEPRGQAAGKAFIFERTGSSVWVLRADLVAGDASAGSHFGTAVSVDHHTTTNRYTAVVGAPSAGAAGAGAAYLFEKLGEVWSQSARYAPSSRTAGDQVGRTVLIDEDHVLVGAPGANAGAGVALAIEIDTTALAWHERARHEAPQPEPAAAFGQATASSERGVAIGAPGEAGTGAVYLYDRSTALYRPMDLPEVPGSLEVFPNPFYDSVTITGAYAPSITIYDLLGRHVATLTGLERYRENRVVWSPGPDLPAGIYVLSATNDTGQTWSLVTYVR